MPFGLLQILQGRAEHHAACHETPVHPFDRTVPQVYIAAYAAELSFSSHLFTVCVGGFEKAWPYKGDLSVGLAYSALQSLLRRGQRPGSVRRQSAYCGRLVPVIGGNVLDLIMNPINQLFGWIINLCYSATNSYGLAIILFTLVTKVLLLPFAIKQQRSTMKNAIFQPKVQELQKKYANDRQKLGEEMGKLQQEGYSPMSGCLPLLIQFPVIIGLYNVIRNPLTYISRLSNDMVNKILEVIQNNGGLADLKASSYGAQIRIADAIPSYMDKLKAALPDIFSNFKNVDLHFLGLNLGLTPEVSKLSVLWIIPLLSGGTAFLMGYITQKLQAAITNPDNNSQTQKVGMAMILTMPLMSLFFTFTMPAGVGLYWITSNVLAIAQTYALNYFMNPKEHLERVAREAEAKKQRRRELIRQYEEKMREEKD